MTTNTAPELTIIGDVDTLLAAGITLATLAEPGRDLDAQGSDVLEIAEALRFVGKGMQHAQEVVDDIADGRSASLDEGKLWDFERRRLWTRDEIDLARDNDLKRERAIAYRTLARALVSLQALVVEMGRE